jgi:hypothetical protein
VNASELAIDGLAAQECESLASCIARGQEPASYADIVAKLRGHCDKLPLARKTFWAQQCASLGVTLFPQPKPAEKPLEKPKAK